MATSRTIAITGANSGIGLRAAAQLAAAGHTVLALCRDAERSSIAISAATGNAQNVRIVQTDLSSPTSIRRAADEMKAYGALDALINNAAIFDLSQKTAAFTAEGNELFWATNHLGPFELTARLSPLLAAAPQPRIVFIASKGLITMPWLQIRFDQLNSATGYSPTKAYYQAKLAQVMTATSLAERVPSNVGVSCIRVPAVKLDSARLAAQPALLRALYAPKNAAAATPETLAATYVRAATRSTPQDGVYIDENDHAVPIPRSARDGAARERLWALSEHAAGDVEWAW
ncbi:SDR family NAD(P)-dependent oxidoreductase [Salinibacterium sp. NK8237]|uniref:SDR family NAD(P)-dependent oxidoreductase n=1 Tax=Salinibacterium sp. NK8237 TaxID=2792038 RepID=UPI0018CED61F|nr:SDR family NAD(P)-dependent oxidoreductase [Salinibacterium sp. NK8237]MBH0129593.1 SDR family NAD(P)-dependent oxidoreductase [Salinibacterium sp. NK8237]